MLCTLFTDVASRTSMQWTLVILLLFVLLLQINYIVACTDPKKHRPRKLAKSSELSVVPASLKPDKPEKHDAENEKSTENDKKLKSEEPKEPVKKENKEKTQKDHQTLPQQVAAPPQSKPQLNVPKSNGAIRKISNESAPRQSKEAAPPQPKAVSTMPHSDEAMRKYSKEPERAIKRERRRAARELEKRMDNDELRERNARILEKARRKKQSKQLDGPDDDTLYEVAPTKMPSLFYMSNDDQQESSVEIERTATSDIEQTATGGSSE